MDGMLKHMEMLWIKRNGTYVNIVVNEFKNKTKMPMESL